MKILVNRPVITEKTLNQATRGWYTFAAEESATKVDIKREVEFVYGVTVTAVRSIHEHGKVRRVGKSMRTVRKPDWKKTMVQLKKGQRIDAFDVVPTGEKSVTEPEKTKEKKEVVNK